MHAMPGRHVDRASLRLHTPPGARLTRLREVALGIFTLDAPGILESRAFAQLHTLNVGPTKKRNVVLSPIAAMEQLRDLAVFGQHVGADAIGGCAGLQSLRVQMASDVSLSFVSRLHALRTLELLLGGRDHIDEIEHAALTDLKIVRVRGFARIEPRRFPSLERLQIEDQLRLESLAFTGANRRLQSVVLINCKRLHRIEGLDRLDDLDHLRISRTAVDFDELLAARLPRSLRTVGLYTGRRRADVALRARLDGLGYREFSTATP